MEIAIENNRDKTIVECEERLIQDIGPDDGAFSVKKMRIVIIICI